MLLPSAAACHVKRFIKTPGPWLATLQPSFTTRLRACMRTPANPGEL